MAKINSDRKDKRLSGVVLIMVVTVMFILIIMLLATLSVVSTAQNRYYTKYEENQAYYTARSALDVFNNDLLKDKNYYAYDSSGVRTYIHGDNVTTDKMTQGLALQLDLYKITAQSGHNFTQSKLTTYANGITDSAKKKDEYKNYFGTDNADASGVLTDSVTGNEYIEYQITFFPTTSSSSDNYGDMVDRDKADMDSDGKKEVNATIRVEVLDRKYNLGSYTDGSGNTQNVAESDVTDFLAGTGAYSSGISDSMRAEAIANGTRSKDKMRIKITSTVTFMGVESTAVLVYDTNEPPVNNSSRAITTFGGSGSDNMSVVGGASMRDNVTWSNDGYIYGSVYAEKNLTMNTGADVFLSSKESFFVGGDFEILNSNFNINGPGGTTDEARPILYVGGKLKSNNLKNTTFNEIDIISHGIEITNGSFYASNNVYCLGDCDLGGADSVNLSGDLYVLGDLRLKSNAISFDSVTGTYTFNGGGMTGNIYISGNAYINGALTTCALMANCEQKSDLTTTFTLPDLADLTSPIYGSESIGVTMPGGVKKSIPTHVENFNDYYQKDADGDLIDSTGAKITSLAQSPAIISAEANAKVTGFTAADIGATQYLTSGTTVDTSGADNKYIIKAGTSYGTINVTGGGTAEFVFETPGQYTNTKIIVDTASKTTVKFYGATGSYQFFGFSVYNTETDDACNNGAVLNVGNMSGKNIKVPKIYYYFADGSDVELYNSSAFLTGYFYAPGAKLRANASPPHSPSVCYNGTSIGTINLTVVGAVLCDEISLPNENGVAYINPDLDDSGNAGEPIHDWAGYQYTRK
ncbi:MAG: hypothetical protein ACI4I1_05270 [Oscillospiraceae bacterium]